MRKETRKYEGRGTGVGILLVVRCTVVLFVYGTLVVIDRTALNALAGDETLVRSTMPCRYYLDS